MGANNDEMEDVAADSRSSQSAVESEDVSKRKILAEIYCQLGNLTMTRANPLNMCRSYNSNFSLPYPSLGEATVMCHILYWVI